MRNSELARLATRIEELTLEVASLKGESEYLTERKTLQQSVFTLEEELESLRITKARLNEDNERELREVKHKVGLEKMRQEFEHEQKLKEIATATAAAVLEARESNLVAERAAFGEQMKFQNERFSKEVGYLKDLMEKAFDQMPKVDVRLGGKAAIGGQRE